MNRTNIVVALREKGFGKRTQAGPLYKQLAYAINDLVQDGDLKPSTALPGERDLAEALELGRVTVRNAYRELMSIGILEPRHGSGTFVSEKVERMEQPLWRLSSFSADMRSRGRSPSAKVIKREIRAPSPQEVFLLGLQADEPVLSLDRLRLADDLPLAIERALVPVKFIGTSAESDMSLYGALTEKGYRPVRAQQRLTAVTLDSSSAAMLKVHAGAAALLIERISRLEDHRIVEYTRSHYRGDAYDFVAELKIGDEK